MGCGNDAAIVFDDTPLDRQADCVFPPRICSRVTFTVSGAEGGVTFFFVLRVACSLLTPAGLCIPLPPGRLGGIWRSTACRCGSKVSPRHADGECGVVVLELCGGFSVVHRQGDGPIGTCY